MKISTVPGWTAACAIGFGLGFPVHILLEQLAGGVGFRMTMHLVFGPVKDPVAMAVPLRDSFYTGSILSLLAFGTILGIGQGMALRGRLPRITPWVLSGTLGFLAVTILAVWPLHATIGWGKIAGPVEPIVITLGGGSLVAVLQNGCICGGWASALPDGSAVGLEGLPSVGSYRFHFSFFSKTVSVCSCLGARAWPFLASCSAP